MKSLTLFAAVALLGAGCGAAATDHTLVSDAPEEVSAGSCVTIEGPYALPDGAGTSVVVTDADDTDYLNVGVIDASFGCDFSSGYAVALDANSTTTGDSDLPAGNYELFVQCENASYPCDFSVTWTASY